jgi:hypothetical protein
MENQPSYQQPFTPAPIALPNAAAVLVLGIISIVGCCGYGIVGLVCGIIAIVLSNKDLKMYKADPSLYTPGSYSNLKSGRVCAIVGLSLSALAFIFIVIYFFVIGAAILTHPYEMFNQHTSVSM